MFTAVRCKRIRNLRHLAADMRHGRRQDPASKGRVAAERTPLNLASSRYTDDPLALTTAWHKASTASGAVPYGTAAIALHLILIIAPELVAEAGDPHDPENPINQTLAREGVVWAEDAFGEGAVFASRLDVDEVGSGVLDLFVMPVCEVRINRYATKKIISVSKPLARLQALTGERSTFAALQTHFAAFAQKRIDPRLRRGRPKAETARDHLHADYFRPIAQAIAEDRAEAAAALVQAQRECALAEDVRRAAQRESALAAQARADAECVRADAQASREESSRQGVQVIARARQALAGEIAQVRREAKAIQIAAADQALTSIRLGVNALLDGVIERVDATGRIDVAQWLTDEEAGRLRRALEPAVAVGLSRILAAVRSDRSERGAARHSNPSHDPIAAPFPIPDKPYRQR